MTLPTLLYFTSILLTGALTGFLAFYAWRQPALPGVRAYALLALSECLLALVEILSMLSSTQAQALFWFNLRFIFMAILPIFFLAFALAYSGQKGWLSKKLWAGFLVIPVITQIMLWSNGLHGLWVKQEVGFHQNGPLWIAETSARIPGLWFMLHSFYSLILLMSGIVVILLAAWRVRQLYRGQALLLSAGALVALITALIPIFNLLPQAEFNPFIPGIGASAVLYALAILRFQFLKRPPAPEGAAQLTGLDAQGKRSLAVFSLIFILFASAIAAASYLTYRNYEKHFRTQLESQLSAIASLKVNELQDWRSGALVFANLFYQNDDFSDLVRRYLETPGDTDVRARLASWLEKIRTNPEYERVFLLDTEGHERISSPGKPESPAVFLIDQIAPTLASGQVTLLDFHRDVADGPIHLALLIPIFTRQYGSPLGILVLRIDPGITLYPYLQEWPAPSQSAETLLVRREGEAALFLNPLRFQPDAALNLRIPLEEAEIPSVKAIQGQEGVMEGLDYRGAPVIADVQAVPGSPWLLVAKMDAAEVYAPLHERLWQTVIFFGALILAAGAGLMQIWRQQRLHHYREQVNAAEALRASEEKFRLAFLTSPDSITITRLADGMFISVNKGFEQITGYTPEETTGKSTSDINIWKDPEDRKKFIEELQAKSEIRNYEAAFLTRTGEIYGLMSAALLELDGVPHILSIVRDISERRQGEEKLEAERTLLRTLIDNLPDRIYVKDVQGRKTVSNIADWQVSGGKTMEDVIGKTDFDTYPPELAKDYWALDKTVIDSGISILNREEPGLNSQGNPVRVLTSKVPLRDGKGKVVGLVGIGRDITEQKRAEKLQDAIYKIAQATDQVESLDALYPSIHTIIQDVMDADNFYIALYDKKNDLLSFPYSVDEIEPPDAPQKPGKGLTEYVLRTAKSLLCDDAMFEEIKQRGEVELIGANSLIWLGVPLLIEGRAIGVMAVQDYKNAQAYTEREQHILEFVSSQVATAIHRKQTETALRESEVRYHNLFENSPIPLWEEDFSAVKRRLDGLQKQGVKDLRTYLKSNPQVVKECASLVKFVDVNKVALKLYQVGSKEELLANGSTVLNQDLYEQFRDELVWISEGQTQFNREIVDRTSDGRLLDISLSWSVAPGHENDLSKVIVSTIDITERVRMQEALSASEAELRALFTAMTDVVIVYDADGRYVRIAPTNTDNLYRPPDDMLGKTVHEILPKEQADYIVAKIRTALQSGEVVNGEYSLQIGGKEIWFAFNASRLSENTVVWAAHDITERKQVEQLLAEHAELLEEKVETRTQALRAAQEQLVRQERLAMLGQLAGSVSHELRNPLGVIANAVYFLSLIQPDAETKVKEYLDIINNEILIATKIITDLLDFSRLSSVEQKPFIVADLVKRTLERFPAPTGVSVTLDLPENLPEVCADPQQVVQVLGNLVVNAYQAMPQGGSLVISNQLSATSEQKFVAVSVGDTGVGIPPENMEKLFEPLFTTKIHGIGLGLPVCKNLAEANGGRIEVESESGKGSTFTLYLPAQETYS